MTYKEELCQLLQTNPSTDTVALGNRIRQARDRFGWSLADLAGRTGLSRAYISALERGKGKRPGAAAIRRLEDVLGPLWDGVGAPPKNDELPAGLRSFASERGLPDAEVRMLASLRIRGKVPETPERWRFIYDALLSSEKFDESAHRHPQH